MVICLEYLNTLQHVPGVRTAVGTSSMVIQAANKFGVETVSLIVQQLHAGVISV